MKYYLIVLKKELIEVIRDKNSLIMSLIMMLIIPSVIVAYSFQQNSPNNVAIAEGTSAGVLLCEYIETPYEIVKSDEVVKKIENGDASLGIVSDNEKLHMIYDENSEKSLEILNKVSVSVEHFDHIDDVGLNEKILYEGLSSYSKNNTSMIASIIPVLIIFAIMTGNGNGVAFNIFTGEKERGSMEALLLTQIKRSTLFFSKLSVVAMMMLAEALIYLIVIAVPITIIQKIGMVSIDLPNFKIMHIVLIGLTLITFSLFVASYVSVVSIKSKTIREAQLMTMLMSFLISGIGFAINMGLVDSGNFAMAIVPAVNTMYILKELFCGNIKFAFVMVTNILNIIFIFINTKIGSRLMSR